ncbi:MAG: hypothetical protein N3G74_00650 [Candidatus Micrarchaeota archaeon]|nr:hypothetical protein [Candidatus Micrarchaeota archaeon]
MNDTITQQMQELEAEKKEKLESVKKISEEIRALASEIEKIRKTSGLGSADEEKRIMKQINQLDFKISTAKNLPLKVEKEIAKKIHSLEERLKKIRELKQKMGVLKEMEGKISQLKNERDKIKKEIDEINEEIDALKQEKRVSARRKIKEAAVEQFSLGDIAAIKRKK